MPRQAQRRWLLLALVLGVAIAGVFTRDAGDGVEAHALLVRADPPVNAQLREPPGEITLYFSEPLEQNFSRVTVVDQDGERVDERFEFLPEDEAAMRVFLAPLEPGFVTINWETLSTVDGHRITGSYPLTILNEDGSLPAGEPTQGSASVSGEEPAPLRVVTKWVLLIAGSVVVGVFAFRAYVMRPGRDEEQAHAVFDRRVVLIGAAAVVVLAFGGLLELALQAADIGAGAADVVETQWGERWLLRTLVLVPVALVVAGQLLRLAHQRLFALAGLLGAGVYLALTSSVSHGAAGGGSFWGVASDFVHLMASSVWIGMLALLVLLFAWARSHLGTAQRYPVIATALQRFSVLAVISVALLMLTGTINAVIEVGQVSDLLETGYGRALALKLAMLIPLLGIAGYNAYLLRPDLVEAAEGQTGTRERQDLLQRLEQQLDRRIRIELVIAVAVLAVVALLVQLTPTRGRLAPPEQGGGDYVATMEFEDLQATLRITPNEPGINTFEVYLAGGVDVVESLRLEFISPTGFAEESRLVLDASNPPTFYLGQGPYLSEAGDWTIILNIRRNEGADPRLPFEVSVEGGPGAASAGRTGGAFDSPIEFNTTTVALLVLSGVASVAIVAGSVPRRDLPEGYLGWLAAEAAYRLGPLNVRPVWTLGALVVIGIGVGLVVGNHFDPPLSQDEASEDNPVPATEESIARGRMLFMDNCALCHGESGRGDGPAAASLPLQPANLYDHIPFHPDQFFFGVISKGLSGVMPAFEDQISEEDRWNILNYLRDTFTEDPAQR